MIVTASEISYARSVATKTMRLWPRSEWDDGYADAMVGLCEAAASYRPEVGAFKAFAFVRIRGAVIDGLRSRIGRPHRISGRKRPTSEPLPVHLIDAGVGPEELALESEMRRCLTSAINRLSARSRLIVTLYFFEGMMLKEIGGVLGVSEGRVSYLVRKITAGGVFDGLRAV